MGILYEIINMFFLHYWIYYSNRTRICETKKTVWTIPGLLVFLLCY